MSTNEVTLKPCPFCGSTFAEVLNDPDGDRWKWCVSCLNDTCHGGGVWLQEKDTVIEGWNKRPIEDALREERDSYREALERITKELGVPDENYPAPVANACNLAKSALESYSRP